jgi:hypothetical protein
MDKRMSVMMCNNLKNSVDNIAKVGIKHQSINQLNMPLRIINIIKGKGEKLFMIFFSYV